MSRFTAGRACRELARIGLVRLVPGHGYYPGDALGGTAEPSAMTRELLAEAAAVQDILAADRISAGDCHRLDDLQAVLEQRQRQADTDA